MSGDRRQAAPSAEIRPLRRLIRVPGDFHCEVVADGLALVRFRIDQIQEGEERWRDLHYSYWRHLA
ncbi:hypothetical protein [Nitrospira moscoviensis]|nr:hypothetical protein [Nitrospira moscoviensis]